jgi:hypothetical protein
MATQGTPNEGLSYIAGKVYITGVLTLVLYTNAADSLTPSTVYADLTQPTSINGYAPILLNGTWTISNGIVTYVHSTPTHPTWSATGAWSATVRGVAIVDVSSTKILHFKDLTSAFTASLGKKLEVDLSTVVG